MELWRLSQTARFSDEALTTTALVDMPLRESLHHHASADIGDHRVPLMNLDANQHGADWYCATTSKVYWNQVKLHIQYFTNVPIGVRNLLNDCLDAMNLSPSTDAIVGMSHKIHFTYGVTDVLTLVVDDHHVHSSTSTTVNLNIFEIARAKHDTNNRETMFNRAMARDSIVWTALSSISLVCAFGFVGGILLYNNMRLLK